jgi:hypothetical protein
MDVKKLELYEAIKCGTVEDTGNGILRTCITQVTKKNMNPSTADCLSACTSSGNDNSSSIPSGLYLFCQGFLPPDIPAFSNDGSPAASIAEAALALWLEFIWEEKEPENTTVYVRLLLHEGEYTDKTTGQKKSTGTVFQLFRRIKTTV